MKEIWANNMVPVIERWERHISVAGKVLELQALKEELDEFIGGVSNPKNIQDFLDKWEKGDADTDEGLVEPEEEANDVEVVVLEDEEEDEEEDGSLMDFIVHNEDEEEEEGDEEDEDEE